MITKDKVIIYHNYVMIVTISLCNGDHNVMIINLYKEYNEHNVVMIV